MIFMMPHTDYTLFMSQRSPFARRIRLTMNRLGIPFEERTVDVFEHNPELLAANPLGMVPTLVTNRNEAISDSGVILEFLDDLTGKIWPKGFRLRAEVRQAAGLAAGVIQSSVLYFQETKMHEVPSPRWVAEHLQSMTDTLAYLEKTPEYLWIQNGELTQAGWDLCVGMEYVALRAPQIDLQTKIKLNAILEKAKTHDFFIHSTPRL